MNGQPWAFVIVQNQQILKQISDAAKQKILASSDSVHHTEHSHVPLGDPKFAGQNMMLAAVELGLATCPIGFARDVLRDSA